MSHVPDDMVHNLYEIITYGSDNIKDVCARLDTWSSIWPDILDNKLIAQTKTAELKALAKCMK